MMPELGKYAEVVLSAYIGTFALILGLVIWSVVQSNRAKRELLAIEKRGNI